MTSKDDYSMQERQVTVRVLTIGTKQVTQTMYKQLPEEDLIQEETGCLNGNIWGWVNLHDGNCRSVHYHAIWENNGQLKRSCAYLSSDHDGFRDHLISMLSDLSTIYTCFLAIADKKLTNWKRNDEHIYLTIKGLKVRVKIPYPIQYLWNAPDSIERYQKEIEEVLHTKDLDDFAKEQQIESKQHWIDKTIEGVKDYKDGGVNECLRGKYDYLNPQKYSSYEQVYAEMERRAEEINIRDQNWRESYKAIEQAGQLFIAVSGVWK